jgi:anti-anti-sigma factor
VVGEVDFSNAERLEAAVASTEAAHVVLDLAGLEYVDSAGIRAIDRCYRELASQGRSLSIVSPPGTRAAWTFRIAGFGDGIVFETLELAMRRGQATDEG